MFDGQVLQCIESLYVDKLKPFGPALRSSCTLHS